MNQAELVTAEVTSQVDCTATTEATANTVITLSAVVLGASDAVAIDFYVPEWRHSNATNVSFLTVFRSTNGGAESVVGRFWDARAHTGAVACGDISAWVRDEAPGAGSHVYRVGGHTGGGTLSLVCGAGGSGVLVPIHARVVQVA